jgi:hypothetical protein
MASSTITNTDKQYEAAMLLGCTVRVFRQEFTLEDAIGSHACSQLA